MYGLGSKKVAMPTTIQLRCPNSASLSRHWRLVQLLCFIAGAAISVDVGSPFPRSFQGNGAYSDADPPGTASGQARARPTPGNLVTATCFLR